MDISPREVAMMLPANAVVIEIGAHDGSETAAILAAKPDCTIICYEPDSRPLARLVERFSNEPRVSIRPWAISSYNGVSAWHASHGKVGHMEDWDYSGSIRQPTHHLERSPEITFDKDIVQCRRLDDCIAGKVDFAWIDVQGAQRDVIAGGRRVLNNTPLVYIECHNVPEYDGEPSFSELCELFPMHDPMSKHGENILFRKR